MGDQCLNGMNLEVTWKNNSNGWGRDVFGVGDH